MKCEWCRGRGYMNVEKFSSLIYTCPDCNGEGHVEENEDYDEAEDLIHD